MLENDERKNEFDENRDENINNETNGEEIFEESDLTVPNMAEGEGKASQKADAPEGEAAPETEGSGAGIKTAAMSGDDARTEAASPEMEKANAGTGETMYSYDPASGKKASKWSRKAEKKHRKSMNVYAKVLCCAILFGAVSGGMIMGSFAIGTNVIKPEASVETTAAKLSTAAAENGGSDQGSTAGTGYSVSQVANQCKSSVVAITNQSVSEVQTMFGTMQQESTGSGSGVIIGKNDTELLIATNYHVIENAEELTACFNDSEDAVFKANVKGTDPDNDLAVIAIKLSDISEDVLNSISIATIGDSGSLAVGDQVVAIGNALGLGQSVTSGWVSALEREVTIEDSTATLLQTDAAINPGNSGGGLFNMKGELVGINSAKYASEQVEGMGFAIPMSTAQSIIEDLMNRETREKLDSNYGYLNISGQDVSEEATAMYGDPAGAYVASVSEGGAAANAGIQQGDIITALGGNKVSGISELKDQLQYYKAGEQVEITFQRNGENGYTEQTVTVTLDNASESQSATQGSQGQDSGEEQDGSFGNDGAQNVPNYGDGNNLNPFGVQ